MITLKEEIRRIYGSANVRGGKKNFSMLNWNVDYFRDLGNEVKREYPLASDNEVVEKVKSRAYNMIAKYVTFRAAISDIEAFNFSHYFHFKKYAKEKEYMERYLAIDNVDKSDEFIKEFSNLYDYFAEILRGDLGVNSAKTLYEIVDMPFFLKSVIFPYQFEGKITKSQRDGLIKTVLTKLYKKTESALKSMLIFNICIFGYYIEEAKMVDKYVYYNRNTLSNLCLTELTISKGDGKMTHLKTFDKVCREIEENSYSANIDQLSILEFIHEIEIISPKSFPNQITFSDLFKVEYLKSLEISDLIALNCFWQNKFSKEIKGMLIFIMMADSYKLFPGIFSSLITHRNLYTFFTDEQFRKAFIRAECLVTQCKKKHSLCTEKREKLFSYEPNEMYDSREIFDNMDYEDFCSSFSSSNPLATDVRYAMVFYRGVELTYFSKELSFYSLIKILRENGHCKNYGIANPDISKNEMCVVRFDYPRLCLPFSVHTNVKRLLEFMKKVMHNTAIPIYKGNDDLKAYDQYLSTSILLPMSKEYSEKLKNMAKEISEKSKRYNLVKHLCILANGKVPNHFKTIKSTGEKVLINEYVDLESGIVFSEKKGSFYRLSDFDV